ncbi:unnamed protein product, partial [Scytosiphon promiscuus]
MISPEACVACVSTHSRLVPQTTASRTSTDAQGPQRWGTALRFQTTPLLRGASEERLPWIQSLFHLPLTPVCKIWRASAYTTVPIEILTSSWPVTGGGCYEYGRGKNRAVHDTTIGNKGGIQ